MKKALSIILTLAMAAGTLTGCSGGAGDAVNSTAAPKKLTVWTNMKVETPALQKLGNEWGKKNGYQVKVVHQSPTIQQFAQAVKSADGPDAVVGIPNDQLADYINAKLAMEVPKDTYKDEDFSEAAVQSCYTQGKRYAAPIAVETVALFYNTDLVSKAPSTWEELVKTAQEKGGVQFDATSIYYDLGFLRACGGYIFQYKDGAYNVHDIGLNNDGAVKAYTFINSLCKTYKYVSKDVTADIARSNFQNGKTAFYIGGPWDIDGFQSAGTHFKVVEMPTFNGQPFVTPVGTQVGFVSSQSKNQQAAWKFTSYVMNDGAEALYQAGSRIPAKLSEQKKNTINHNESTRAFIAQINHGEPMPTVSEMGKLWDIHTNNIRSMWSGELTPKEAADNIVKQLKEADQLMDAAK